MYAASILLWKKILAWIGISMEYDHIILRVVMTVVYSIGNLLTSSFYLSYLSVLHEHLMNFTGFILTTPV